MKFFNKEEKIAITLILSAIIVVSFGNFRISIRRARDAQRRADLGDISKALGEFHRDFGFFPPSENGKIKACKSQEFDNKIEELKLEKELVLESYFAILFPCEWGKDSLRDLTDLTYSAYLETIPGDPAQEENIYYLYLSSNNHYQLYAYLEGEDEEIGYDEGIVKRYLMCGNQICNFGKSFGQTPLDKSIQEYENELLLKKK